MFPDDEISPRAVENRPGIVYDEDKLSNLYVEDYLLATDHIKAIEDYLLAYSLIPAILWDLENYRVSIQNRVLVTPPGEIDEYCKLMLHFNGEDESTDFVDSESVPKDIIAAGTAKMSTAQKKFGTASGIFNASGDYVYAADHNDFFLDTDDFTIDFCIRPISRPAGTAVLVAQRVDVNNNNMIYFSSATRLYFQSLLGSNYLARYYYDQTWNVDQWYHIAIVRHGSNLYLFVDGVSKNWTVSNAIGSNSLPNFAASLLVGGYSSTPALAYIDEFRWSKGIARWVSNFTPPSSEYATGEPYLEDEVILKSEDVTEGGIKGKHTFGINGGNTVIESSHLNLHNLPTSNPHISGRVWNDAGTIKISTG